MIEKVELKKLLLDHEGKNMNVEIVIVILCIGSGLVSAENMFKMFMEKEFRHDFNAIRHKLNRFTKVRIKLKI